MPMLLHTVAIQNASWNMAASNTSTTTTHPTSLWIPVTEEELQPYLPCQHAFRHCCIGQNRRIQNRKRNVTSLLMKWHEPLFHLTHVLQALSLVQHQRRHQHSSHTDDNHDFCNLWFVEDSTTADYAIGAMCELTRMHGYEIVDCVPGFGRRQWGEEAVCERLSNASVRLYHFTHFWLRHPTAAVCPNVIVRLERTMSVEHTFMNHSDNSSTTSLSQVSPSELSYLHQGGLTLWIWGAHCHLPGCMERIMKSQLIPFVHQWHAQWIVQWREMEPSHFDSPGHIYETLPNPKPQACVPHNNTSTQAVSSRKKMTAKPTTINTYNNFRNEEATTVLAHYHQQLLYNTSFDPVSIQQLRIPTIPVVHALASQWDWHANRLGDCTHYVYTPWRFSIVWDGMVKAMLWEVNTTIL
jgi:hypothetical protein